MAYANAEPDEIIKVRFVGDRKFDFALPDESLRVWRDTMKYFDQVSKAG